VTSFPGNCVAVTATSVTITPAPTISAANYTDPLDCTSTTGTITLSGLLPNTSYSTQYYKNGGAPILVDLVSNNSGVVTISNLSGGTYSNISVTSNGCTSNVVGPFTLIETNPALATPKAAGNSPLCVGSNLTLTSSTTSTGNLLYQWDGPNGFTSNLQNPIINNVTLAAGGRYYVLVRSNNCSSLRDSVEVLIGNYPTVNLGPDLTLAPGSQHRMNPVIQNGPISQYTWTPTTNLSCSNCPSPIATIQNNITYTLKVTNTYGCSTSDTVSIKVICDKSNVFIPDAFTPDGDGINDIFMIRASGNVRVKYLRIFNKWGELVFEKMNFLPNNTAYAWDGKVRKGNASGIIVPDVFVYTAEVLCDSSSGFTYKGNVSVLR
jgi:gliding motility-associated-like protein